MNVPKSTTTAVCARSGTASSGVLGLPKHVGPDAIDASYDAGVLTVRVHGANAGTQAQRIAVTAVPRAEQAIESEPA